VTGASAETIEFPVCDQYTIQASLFSETIRGNRDQEIPLEDAIRNMAVIDALVSSATTGQWKEIH
jgi:predicted dehydrogenase